MGREGGNKEEKNDSHDSSAVENVSVQRRFASAILGSERSERSAREVDDERSIGVDGGRPIAEALADGGSVCG